MFHSILYDTYVSLEEIGTLILLRDKNTDLYKGKVFYVQEPPSLESTTTEYGVNYQLLAVICLSNPINGELLVAVGHNQL